LSNGSINKATKVADRHFDPAVRMAFDFFRKTQKKWSKKVVAVKVKPHLH